ncbi:MAG: hypothetical protein AAFQ18_00665 [Pseudomonadota bacterium]
MREEKSQMVARIFDAARMRGLAYFNAYDTRWVEDLDRKIRFYVDPAVAFVMMLWPGRLQDDREAHNRGYLATISEIDPAKQVVDAVLCGECLFDPELLSHDRKSAGRATQRLMLPPHWDEFSRRVLQFVSEELADDHLEIGPEFHDAVHDVSRLASETVPNAKGRSLRYSVVRASEQISRISARLEQTRMLQFAALKRIRSQGLVQPSTDLPQNVYRIDPAIINDWSARLRAKGKTSSVRADAIAIAQIEALNEDAKQKRRRERHVLVTSDLHVLSAYYEAKVEKSQYVEIDHDEEPVPDWEFVLESGFMRDFHLRHPAQFLPTLNQSELKNALNSHDLFFNVVDSTEAILAAITNSESAALNMAVRAIRDRQGTLEEIASKLDASIHLTSSSLSDDVKRMRENWSALVSHSVYVNRSLLKLRAEAAGEVERQRQASPESFLRSLKQMQENIRREVQESQDTQLSVEKSAMGIARDNWEIGWRTSAPEAFPQLCRSIAEGYQSGFMAQIRFSPKIFCDFSDLIGDNRLRDVIAEIQKDKNASIVSEINKNISNLASRDLWRAQLLSGIMAAFLADWQRVVWYGSMAAEAIQSFAPDAEEYYEARYLVALGHRMRLSQDEYVEAEKCLTDSIAAHEKRFEAGNTDPRLTRLKLARDLAELATLRLFEQVRRRRHPMEPPALPATTMDEGRAFLERADALLTDLEPIERVDRPNLPREQALIATIMRQVSENKPVFDLLGHFIFPDEPGFPDGQFDLVDFEMQINTLAAIARRLEMTAELNLSEFDEIENTPKHRVLEQADFSDKVGMNVLEMDLKVLLVARNYAKDILSPDQIQELQDFLKRRKDDESFGTRRSIDRLMLDVYAYWADELHK